jgi:hypothetical protein
MWAAQGNLPAEKDITFKFTVDAANPPVLVAGPINNYISSVARTAQGTYVLTLADSYLKHVCSSAEVNVNVPTAIWAQPGPIANFGQAASAGLPTVTIFTVDNASTAQNPPAANANVFVSGVIVCCDIAAT